LLPGVFPSTNGRPKLIMAMDIDYPPYAYLKQAPFSSRFDLDEVSGVGADMIKALASYCNFDVHIVQAHWKDCWDNGEIGKGLLQGWYHGCMTYTHAAGVRNRYIEFTNSWASVNKPSGLITRLTNGVPHIKGTDNLNGKTIVDVSGWAPTADTLHFVKNQCTQNEYSGFTVIQSSDVTNLTGTAYGDNDKALLAVLEGKADAMWVYADQAANYHCATNVTQPGWNCALWNKFGTDFAYVQTGMFAWMHNGTTVAMAKKGSGVSELIDNCLARFMPTQEFLDVCKIEHGDPAHSQINACVPNEHFFNDPAYSPKNISKSPYMFPTSDMKGNSHTCSTGYCHCDE